MADIQLTNTKKILFSPYQNTNIAASTVCRLYLQIRI